ncbi:MAG: chitobiase/beta-hexosaminidase C-terminal domain-containing protein, partial [bacterium]
MRNIEKFVFNYLAPLSKLLVVALYLNSCESQIQVTQGGLLPGANGTVEAPTFSLSSGTYEAGTQLELATKTLEGEIYYTTDGETPTEKSTKYNAPINLLTSQTIKAFAVQATMQPSTVVKADYVIVPVNYGSVSEPVATPEERTFDNAVSVTLSTIPLAATIYYSTDGSEPSLPYTSPIELTRETRLKAKARLNGYTDSTVMDQTFTFKVADPVFSIPQGTYGPSQIVLLSSATTGATVHYTTDGTTEPTCNSASGPLTVSQSMTVKAVGCKDGYTNSEVGSANYTINGSVATPTFSISEGSYGPSQTVALSTSTPDSIIYYTTDGLDPTILSSVYSAPITVSSTTIVKAFAVKADFINSTIASSTYTINGSVNKPVAIPPGGNFNNDVSVTISTIPFQASIVYSLDNTTIDTPYSAALNISATTTLQAKASMTNYTDSEPLTEVYTMVVADPVFSVQDSATRTVQISTITNGATIYYTIDGSDPSPTSTQYSSAVSIQNGQVLKAIAARPGYNDSAVVPFVDDGKFYVNGALANGFIKDQTVMLLHMNGSNGSQTFTDSSAYGHTITP